jgi:transcriptional regulator with XRE-family HTH domain
MSHAHGDVQIRFGKAVRARPKKVSVSQREFADLCGLDRTYIGGIEREQRNVSLIITEKIVKACEISLSELFKSA